MRPKRSAAALFCLALGAVACPSSSDAVSTTPTTSVSGPSMSGPSVAAGGAPTAAAAIRKLCVAPAGSAGATHSGAPSGAAPPAATPPQIAEIEHEVEQVRGLTYEHPVAVESVTADEMQRRVEDEFDTTYPAEYYDRRNAAWRTIGVIPPDSDLREALRAFLGGQVIGFYDPDSKELVYEGSGDLGLEERLVLAHELTHALDDQHFDLRRLDDLAARCRDEASQAALGLIEGNAQFVATGVLERFPTGDLGDALRALLQGAGEQPDLSGVPPFVQSLEIWPYTAGLTFVSRIAMGRGGAAVDEAFRHSPTTTEQVIHPELYPTDVPSAVDVPDLSGDLGPTWGDLDAMDVGEEWLDAMLRLRLDGATADAAATGWDGGVYRAWTDGNDVAVVMDTAWDSVDDATAFASAVTSWAGGDGATSVHSDGNHVMLAFATRSSVLDRVDATLAIG
jgi:hypothetical protein